MTTPAKPTSDTPRTDAFIASRDHPRIYSHFEVPAECLDFARQLERENAELREALIPLAALPCDDHCAEIADYRIACIHQKARAILARTAQGKEQGKPGTLPGSAARHDSGNHSPNQMPN